MSEGWLLLHRKMQDNGLWQDKPFAKGQAWIDLLMSASHKDHSFWIRGLEVKVKEGQVALSELSMKKRWGWSRDKVRRFLSYLQDEGKIRQQKNNVTTLITIIKWKEYQKTRQQTIHQTNTKQTPNDTQSINGKNGKNVNKSLLPENYRPSESVYEWAKKKDHNINEDDIEAFTIHHSAKGSKFVNWDSAFQNWMRNKKKFSKDDGTNGPRGKKL